MVSLNLPDSCNPSPIKSTENILKVNTDRTHRSTMNKLSRSSTISPAMNTPKFQSLQFVPDISWSEGGYSSEVKQATLMNCNFYPIKQGIIDDDFMSPIPIDVETDLTAILDADDLSCSSNTANQPEPCESVDFLGLNEILDDTIQKESRRASSTSTSTLTLTSTSSSSSSPEPQDQQQQRFKPFHEEKWTLRYKELLIFHKEHSHAAVPHTYPKNPQLARWVKRQRRQYKLLQECQPSTMTTERLYLLNEIGFVWDSHDVNWREKLDALLAYRRLHGNCNVSSKDHDKKLATWVKCQRRQYKLYREGKASSMTLERISDLESLGFEWEIRGASSRKMLLPAPISLPTGCMPLNGDISYH